MNPLAEENAGVIGLLGKSIRVPEGQRDELRVASSLRMKASSLHGRIWRFIPKGRSVISCKHSALFSYILGRPTTASSQRCLSRRRRRQWPLARQKITIRWRLGSPGARTQKLG